MTLIKIEKIPQIPIPKQQVEIVERKGLGHPDTIADLIAREISLDLNKIYLKRFGAIMHYNVDKSLIAAGEAETKFGGGVVKKPILIVLGDRATYRVGDEEIPVDEIAIRATRRTIKKNFRFIDPYEHIRIQVEIHQGSQELTDIFRRKQKVLGANDTSACVGYAPLSPLEKLIIELEKWLNSRKFKKEYPETGEDIKIMGIRTGEKIDFTIALAFVDRFVKSEKDYFRKKKEVHERIMEFLANKTSMKAKVDINTLDVKGRGENGVYLTVLGTSAESGDSGQVGRGNKVNGVIPLNRPTSAEASAGKNPVSHVGNIYNFLSFKIAKEIYRKVNGLEEVYVWLVSKIGRRIDMPAIANAKVILKKNTELSEVKERIEDIISKNLEELPKFCKELAKGKYKIY